MVESTTFNQKNTPFLTCLFWITNDWKQKSKFWSEQVLYLIEIQHLFWSEFWFLFSIVSYSIKRVWLKVIGSTIRPIYSMVEITCTKSETWRLSNWFRNTSRPLVNPWQRPIWNPNHLTWKIDNWFIRYSIIQKLVGM